MLPGIKNECIPDLKISLNKEELLSTTTPAPLYLGLDFNLFSVELLGN